MMPMPIAFTGPARAGKDTAAKCLVKILESRGFRIMVLPLADSLKRALPAQPGQTKEEYREKLIELGNVWRERYGEAVLYARLRDRIERLRDDVDVVIIPDARMRAEKAAILADDGRVVRLHVPLEVRLARMDEPDRYLRSSVTDVTEIEADAGPESIVVPNDGTVEQLYRRLKIIFGDPLSPETGVRI